MKLYEIDNGLRDLWAKIAEQEGEFTEEDLQQLEELNLAKDEKLKGYGVIVRELDGEIAALKAETDGLKEITDKTKRKREWLVNRLDEFMKANGIPKFESIEVNIAFRKSKSLEIDENAELPKEFIRIKEEADKKAITDFIKSGGTVDGCRLIEKENIQIK